MRWDVLPNGLRATILNDRWVVNLKSTSTKGSSMCGCNQDNDREVLRSSVNDLISVHYDDYLERISIRVGEERQIRFTEGEALEVIAAIKSALYSAKKKDLDDKFGM